MGTPMQARYPGFRALMAHAATCLVDQLRSGEPDLAHDRPQSAVCIELLKGKLITSTLLLSPSMQQCILNGLASLVTHAVL